MKTLRSIGTRLLLALCLLVSLGCDPDIGPLNLNLRSETLTVTVSTVGANLDPDGYMLSVTSHPDTPIGINEAMAFSVMRIDHTVELSGVAANCTVANNPRTISINGATSTTFVVQCT